MRNFKFHQHLLKVLVAISVFMCFTHQCQANRLNSNGGYDIVVGVENNVVEPLSVTQFLEDIQLGIDEFSKELFKATKRRFFINSVDVIVPGNWWTLSKFDTATWQTPQGSEIRLSHDVGAPTAVNPNACGTSGLYVDLPDNFFKVPRGGKFGPIGKALVNLWARYRFGVWEEHGMPGDTKFPYFYAHPSFEPKWEATGCSNEPIIGSFRTIDGEESDRCSPYNSEGPDDDCRFVPSHSNTANSSLMHLHWLESVSEFCDSKTHNYAAPNRQNLFCGHRSIWEVIRESDDYKSTTSCLDDLARPTFRVIKENRSPEFYLLLDRGRTVTPEKVLQEVMAAVTKFVNYPTFERVNIAVGTFPHANQGRNHYYVKEEVGWAPISSVFYDIERVLNASSVPDGPVIRDFGLAIQEVAEKIKQRNHLAGTVILVIKRGASANLFDKISFEQEVIASIKEDSRIKVYAIEAQQGEQSPYTNLQTLVEATSGQYHLINDTMNTARKLGPILATIQEKLEQSSIMNSLSTWTIQKQYTEPHQSIEIPIYDNAEVVKIHLTTHHDMVASDIYLEQISGEHATLQESVKGEWDENADLSRRIVFTYTINNPKPGSVWSLKHGCHTEKLSACRFFLVVTVQNDMPTPRVDDYLFNSQSINIEVSTSATENNYVDMNDQGLKMVPFAIYAKIEMEQQRVLNLENVHALVRVGGEHDNHLGDWVVPLTDDGSGLPDIAKHDGIYSGIFTPLQNGFYQISVAASGVSEPGGSAFQNIRIVNHAGSLMQVDQLSFGCKNSSKPRCASAVPRGSFSRVQDMQSTVFVENAGTFKPGKPTRILDFTVTALPNFNIEFEFTSPKLLGLDEDPEEYRIYMAPHPDNFVGSTELTKWLVTERAKPAGTRVKISFNAASKAIPFYAAEAMYKGQKGGPSNVVGIVTSEHGPIVPSPTTTPPPSTSVTPSPEPPTTTEPPLTTSSEPSSIEPTSTSTTEFPWPTTTPTTPSPYPTTTEESEEDYSDETSTYTPPTTTDGSGITSTISPTTGAPTTTSPATTLDPIVTSSEVTGPISSTTTAAPPTDVTSTSTLSPTSDITEPISSTTQAPTTTTENGEVTSTSSTTTTEDPPITTTEDEGITSSTTTSTEIPTSTTENGGITSSSTTTTQAPTTENGGITSSSTTTTQAPTTEDGGISSTTSSTTTEGTIRTTEDGGITSTTTTSTEAPSSTTENGEISSTPSTTTTEVPLPTTTENGFTGTSSTTTQEPSTTENGGTTSSTTTEPPISTTQDSEVPSSSSTTTETPITSTDGSVTTSTSSSTTEVAPSSTTPSPEITTTSSVPSSSSTVSSTTTEQEITSTIPPSSSSTESSSNPSTSTASPPSSTPDEDVTVTASPTSSSNVPTTVTTPEPTSSSLSTSNQASTQVTPITEPSQSGSAKLTSSDTILCLLTLIYFQIRFFW